MSLHDSDCHWYLDNATGPCTCEHLSAPRRCPDDSTPMSEPSPGLFVCPVCEVAFPADYLERRRPDLTVDVCTVAWTGPCDHHAAYHHCSRLADHDDAHGCECGATTPTASTAAAPAITTAPGPTAATPSAPSTEPRLPDDLP